MIFDRHIQEISELILNYYPGLSKENIQIQETRKEFTGDWTVVVFPLLRFSKKPLPETANDLGEYLKSKIGHVKSFNVVKGFLNLEFKDSFWFNVLEKSFADDFEINSLKNKNIIIESSSPNTNKPLHLGHLRNILLGHAVANILVADGNNVKRVQIINDRGIHICKSMLAWLKFGNGETPESSALKGDYLVGKYYVIFEKKYQEELKRLKMKGFSEEDAKSNSQLMNEAKEMLLKWESGDLEVISLWETMNTWVYSGFKETYERIGVVFDKNYYESDTYLIGKKHLSIGLDNHIFNKKDDGSIWIDLEEYNLDQKLLLRSDGTAVYMTQDLGTAILRYNDFKFDTMIYVVGNEQNHHFNVLFKILSKMSFKWASDLFHLSYGMVNLPDGKMKSREGTVIDIDQLLNEMYQKSKEIILNSNKSNIESIEKLSVIVGDAALKYFILKPDAKKDILFNPEESIDFNGHTGPFIQYTYARINSVLEKSTFFKVLFTVPRPLLKEEINLIKLILNYPIVLSQSATNLNPSILANYLYSLSKEYNHFYQKIPILSVENENDINFRVTISKKVSVLICKGMALLGIDVPLKM